MSEGRGRPPVHNDWVIVGKAPIRVNDVNDVGQARANVRITIHIHQAAGVLCAFATLIAIHEHEGQDYPIQGVYGFCGASLNLDRASRENGQGICSSGGNRTYEDDRILTGEALELVQALGEPGGLSEQGAKVGAVAMDFAMAQLLRLLEDTLKGKGQGGAFLN